MKEIESLIKAMQAQTEAINALAQSNQDLVQAMIESEGMDDDNPTTYLDGSLSE